MSGVSEREGGSERLASQSVIRGPKLRADLIHQTIEMGQDSMVVCKDPLSRAYHHFTQSEHELLLLADGRRSIQEIVIELRRRHPSPLIQSLIQKESVDRFFRQASHQGLLESPYGARRDIPRRRWNWVSLLAIRFPGVNPTKFLNAISPVAGVLFARPVTIASMIAAPVCVIAVLIQFDRFASDFSSISENPLGSLAWIALGIAIAKILHELAHALACRHMKCECPAIGIMLLFGIPCLYADVSDAWMLKRRSHRMLISAAGMYIECWIAILATFVWMASNAGPVHDLAVTLMVVCSVSTILINGNPLLRYDGYYLLSDFTGIANLASRSRESLVARIQTILGNPTSTAEPIWMSIYAFASYIYRCIVMLSVTAIIFRTLQAFDLDLIGILLLLSALTITLFKNARSLRQIRVTRLALAASILIVAAIYPIPRIVVAPMTVAPKNSTELYATEPGFLLQKLDFGKRLQARETVTTLSNPELLRQHAAALASRDRIKTQLQVFQRSRGKQSQLVIPSLQKDLEQADAMVDFHNQGLQRLKPGTSKAGTLYPPVMIQGQSSASSKNLAKDNLVSGLGQWVEAGTPIGIVGDEHRREAILYLRDREVSRIQLDQQVSLMFSDAAKESILGSVISIDTTPCQQFPASLVKTGLLSMPSENIYRVRVQLESSSDDLVVHRVGRAKVRATPESIAHRIYRLISETFG